MPEPPPLSDEDRDDLVAYLDGELDEDSARALEAKLSLDPAAREEAEALKRTWELLDYLPRPQPSPSFTHRTLERLEPVRTAKVPVRRWRWGPLAAGWAAAVLLAGAAGFTAVKFLPPPRAGDPDPELVRDLSLIENKRLYDAADDLDFLHKLDHPDLFGDDSPES
jgi:anti-sigma factor RsiW